MGIEALRREPSRSSFKLGADALLEAGSAGTPRKPDRYLDEADLQFLRLAERVRAVLEGPGAREGVSMCRLGGEAMWAWHGSRTVTEVFS